MTNENIIPSIQNTNDIVNISIVDQEEDNEQIDSNNIKVDGATIQLSKNKFDETQAPKNAYNRSLILKDELHNISSIEVENKKLMINESNFKEGKIPKLKSFIYNILAILLTKSEFSLPLIENNITLVFDISVLSGKRNKNMLATNMMVILHLLSAFDIKFSVWMFADRNLCFCVKKPLDPFDKTRETFIRDAYYLDRINPESDVISAIFTINNPNSEHFKFFEKSSNLFIIFSTFVSAQVLSKSNKQFQNALSKYLSNKKMIGIIEPCPNMDYKIKKILNDTLKDSNSIFFIKFNTICDTLSELLLKISDINQDNVKEFIEYSDKSIDIDYHKFNNNEGFENEIFICKNQLNAKFTKLESSGDLNVVKITKKTNFEIIDMEQFNFGDLNNLSCFLYLNKAKKYELSSHGSIIDNQALIKAYFSNFTNLNIFKHKSHNKIGDYVVDILLDASTIVKTFSINHCFLSAVSLLLSLKDLEISNVNLVVVGSKIIPLLVKKDMKYFTLKNNIFFSQLYSLIYEIASESRSLNQAIEKIASQSQIDSMQHSMFIITYAIFTKEQTNNIKKNLESVQLNGFRVIGIGTGPSPYRIEDIFSWSLWSKNPLMLREAIFKLLKSPLTKNVFSQINSIAQLPREARGIQNGIENSEILKQFSTIEFKSLFYIQSLNKDAFDPSKLTGDYKTNSNYDACKNGAYKGFNILVMMFYQGEKGSKDELITVDTFEKGPKNMPQGMKSPGAKLREKGFDYTIVTTYKDSLTELVTGKYCIAMLCTASIGVAKFSKDENYFEPFLDGIKQFHELGGALLLFGENPPFVFEVNCILDKLKAIKVRLDRNPKNFDKGGKIMLPTNNELTNGTFLSCQHSIDAIINGVNCVLPSLGGGITGLFEGKTLAKYQNIKDDCFQIFSITNKGTPSCIFRLPQRNEGVIFIDNGSSKLFNEYTEEGSARYIINLAMGCVHYSALGLNYYNNMENKGIKVNMLIKPSKESIRFMQISEIYNPLLISIIIDLTGSMFFIKKKCKNKIMELVEECKKHVEINIFLQLIIYRDLTEYNEKTHSKKLMVDSTPITQNVNEIVSFLNNNRARKGGNDGPENMSAGFERALEQIKKNKIDFRNIFILIADAPNQDEMVEKSHFPKGNERDQSWEVVWKSINARMRSLKIDHLVTISCDPYFDIQFKIWEKYECDYILKENVLDRKSINGNDTFDSIFVKHVSERVSSMY